MKGYFSNVLRALLAPLVKDFYEAGTRWSGDRSYLPGVVQDARFDADTATRQEMVRKARWFEANSSVVNRMLDLREQYVSGECGPQMIPASKDEEWNEEVARLWDEDKDSLESTGTMSWSDLNGVSERTLGIDGGHFLLKSSVDLELGQTPRVQFIEGHRVETSSDQFADEGKTIIDGVLVNKQGRRISYNIRTAVDGGSHQIVSVADCLHVFEPSRVGQYREISPLHAVINLLHDLDDLQMLEMRTSKTLAERVFTLFTKNGELSKSSYVASRMGAVTTQASSGVDVIENRLKHVRTATGGKAFAMNVGEDLKVMEPGRPTAAQQEHWDMIVAQICIGAGFPRLIVYPPVRVQGTAARGDYDMANSFFRSRFETRKSMAKWVYYYWLERKVRTELSIADKPADWKRCEVIAPRSINVDVGYNSAATIADLEANITTLQEVHGARGRYWKKVLKQRQVEKETLKTLGIGPQEAAETKLEEEFSAA